MCVLCSSDDEHLARESGSEYHPRKASSRESLSSEDDFEKEMASEVLSALKVMVTPSSFPGRNGPDGTSGTPAVGGASTRPDEQEVTTGIHGTGFLKAIVGGGGGISPPLHRVFFFGWGGTW